MRQPLIRAVSVVLLAAAPALAAERPLVEHLSSGKVMAPDLPFSEAVRVGDVVFLSGQIGILPGTRELAKGGIAAEAKQTMENIRATLEGIGLGMRDLVKCTVMLDDMAEWGAFNEVYKTFFDGRYPARSAFGADGLALGARVEVECIAAARPAPAAE
jgi:2-iminobutanoate/2-iminopropanoate deaminase